MLLTAGAFVAFVFLALLATRKMGRFGTGRMPVLLIVLGAVAIPIAWAFTGVAYLALDILRHMILPIATLTLISFAGTMLLTRNSMLETMREDYVMAARAKGLPEKVVRDRHAARNALLPVITSLVYSLIFAIDGSVIIEGVFSWPGTRHDVTGGGAVGGPAAGDGLDGVHRAVLAAGPRDSGRAVRVP